MMMILQSCVFIQHNGQLCKPFYKTPSTEPLRSKLTANFMERKKPRLDEITKNKQGRFL
jgi:hypothetical protein